MLVIGTMHIIRETPRRICGSSSSQKSQSWVMPDRIQVPMPKPVKPTKSITAASSTRIRRPAIGAVRNMQTPVTNIVSPISSAS